MRNLAEQPSRKRIIVGGAAVALFAAEIAGAGAAGVINSIYAKPYQIRGQENFDCSNNKSQLVFATGLGKDQSLALSGVEMPILPVDPLVTVKGDGNGSLDLRVRYMPRFTSGEYLNGKNIYKVEFGDGSFNFDAAGIHYDASYRPSLEEAGKTSFRLVMSCITS